MPASMRDSSQRDTRSSHDEDEISYVVTRRADFRVGGEVAAIVPGNVLCVPAGMDHRFERIVEDLKLLVVFAAGRGR